MNEFIVLVESSADARTATKLAERVLAEKIDWLEPEMLQLLRNRAFWYFRNPVF